MNKTNSVIEVNGNRYDALTGKILNHKKVVTQTALRGHKKLVDGFVVQSGNLKKSTQQLASARAVKKNAAQGLHQQPQRPKTLMRSGLPRPQNTKDAPKKHQHNQAHNVNPAKEFRAKTVTKNGSVKRFGHMPQAPAQTLPSIPNVVLKNPIVKKASHAATPLPPRVPSMVTSVSHQKLELMLDEALLKAEAHKHMLHQKKRQPAFVQKVFGFPKWARLGAVMFMVSLAAALVVWQNLPAVAVHVAAARAHVNASMPAYLPNGYAFAGPLKYGPGAVTLQFQVKAKPSQSFSITQKASTMDSSSLENLAPASQADTQAATISGTTVYIYNQDKSAAWVNNGVLYTLKNQASLTADQVLKIAQSL